MKESWRIRRLGDVVTRLTNGYVGPTRNIYLESGVPYLLARHVKNNRLIFDGKTFISEEFNRKNKKSMLKGGDVLLVQSGHIGHSAVVTKEHEGHNCHAMIVISPVEDTVTGPFLSLFFNSPEMQRKFEEIRSGSTVPHLTCGAVKEIKIAIPALSEQHRIVGILDEAFANIATAKANAEKNVRNARALFESHLQSVFNRSGEKWETKPLEGVATIRTGKRDANHQLENGPYPFFTCAFGQFRSPTFSFDGASIILPGNGANVGKVFFHDGKFEAYQRTYVVNELSESVNPRFLYYCFSANWPGWIANKQFGSATNYIVVGDLKAFQLFLVEFFHAAHPPEGNGVGGVQAQQR
jgi:type I restriction enzyme S subunit